MQDYIKESSDCENKQLPKPTRTFYSIVVKRILDVLLSSLALIILSPILLVVAVQELVFQGSPVIYKTIRPGKDGKLFCLYKFRSMTNERGNDGLLLPEEKRLTKFGRVLRKTSIDELPELINIIKGDMSILGPRPLLVEYLNYYSPRHALRHSVRPGLACVRISDTGCKTWTWNDQFENDIYYIEHITLATDVKMLLAVVRTVFRGSEERANDTRVPFLGDNLNETRSKGEVNTVVHFESLEK